MAHGMAVLSLSKPEPNLLKILLIIPSSTAQKLYSLFLLFSYHYLLFPFYSFWGPSYVKILHMWLDFGKPTELSHWAMNLFHFIGQANGHTCTLHIHSAIAGLGWLICFSRVNFANPVNSWLRQWDSWRMLHGRHGCEIHPRDRETAINAIQACLSLWLALLGPIANPNSPNGEFKRHLTRMVSI